jgi:hypothetical protein
MDAIKLEPFFVNRDLFKDLPDKVYNLVISQKWEDLKNMIESGQITLEKLINYINDRLNEDVIKRGLYDTSGFNLLSLIFKIIHDKVQEDKEQEIEYILRYDIIKSVLENDNVYKYIYNFPREQFISSLRWFKEKGITTPLDKTIEEINKLFSLNRIDNFDENYINYLDDYIDYLDYIEDSDDIKYLTKIYFIREFILAFKEDKEVLTKIQGMFSELLSRKFDSLYIVSLKI